MATLLFDSFTDSDGTALTSHAMDVGGGWTADNGACTIQSNKAAPPTDTANVIASADAGEADVTITADCVVPNAADYVVGFAVRVQDHDDCWGCLIERDGGGTPYLTIFERVAGSVVLKATANFTVSPTGTTVGLECVTSGDSITLTASTGETCNYGSATGGNARTRHGLFFFTAFGYSTAARVDNFLVTGGVVGGGVLAGAIYHTMLSGGNPLA